MRQLAQTNPKLLRLIGRFHGQPSRFIHPDRWPDDVPQDVPEILQASSNGERRLATWIAEHWQLDSAFQHNFDVSRHRIAMLSPQQLESLILHGGAAIHADFITRNIDRATQSAYKNLLGPDVYNFALKRAGFLTGGLPKALLDVQIESGNVAESLLHVGLQCVVTCLHDAPAELRQRVELMLPPDFPAYRDVPPTADHVDAIWTFVKRLLLTEIAPELNTCFN